MYALKMVDTPDDTLIAAILDGSEDAFQQLIERYQGRLFGLLSRLVRDRLAVEDLSQEVFIKVFRKLHTFNHQSAFYTWLYRIAVNAANDHLEKQSRRKLRLVGEQRTLEEGEGRSEQAEVDQPLLDEELRMVTREILSSLPPKYRDILVLREYEDMSYTDMSATLGCSMGTVESRLFRARKRFKEALETQYPELVPGVRMPRVQGRRKS